MAGAQTVEVALGDRSYSIQIGANYLAEAIDWLHKKLAPSHVIIVFDQAVQSLASRLTDQFRHCQVRVDSIAVPSGENSKSVAELERLWNSFQSFAADRKSIVLAVGGGVVGDLAGFAAASYVRGLRLVQVPTTLLAQVDSSVGGKTGINLVSGKNLVGAFWQPAAVYIDTSVLSSLPHREYLSGLAEVVKYGVIRDPELFSLLEVSVDLILARDSQLLPRIVSTCCRAKADVVQNDEFEQTGERASLNYGHTFGHAFENVYGYGHFLHGEAVSIGMVCAAQLAVNLGMLSAESAVRQKELLGRLGLPVTLTRAPIEPLIDAMGRDKKVAHGQLKFVLPTQLGRVQLVGGVEMDRVRQVLDDAMSAGTSHSH